jgi:hypothetical protein
LRHELYTKLTGFNSGTISAREPLADEARSVILTVAADFILTAFLNLGNPFWQNHNCEANAFVARKYLAIQRALIIL